MIVKQMELRSNIKKYFDIVYSGDVIIVPRKDNKNIVIISEDEYNRMCQADRLGAYSNAIVSQKEKPNRKASLTGNIKKDNLKKLNLIKTLKTGWNGNGAPPISKAVIEKARSLINSLTIQPEIFPTALSSIQFEFDNSRRDHIEIEITEEKTAEIFTVTYDGKEYFETIPSTPDALNKKVAEFYG